MACPRRVGVPQGCAGVSWHILVARETRNASGWQQSKEDRPAPSVAGQRARVRNYTLCEAPGASTPNLFISPATQNIVCRHSRAQAVTVAILAQGTNKGDAPVAARLFIYYYFDSIVPAPGTLVKVDVTVLAPLLLP